MIAASVVIPSYNRRALLEKVLTGLNAQTTRDFEVVVVLDGSTDDSASMLTAQQQAGRVPNLRWHLQANSGQAAARNTGVQLAQAPVIILLDDDIVPAPNLVEAHLRWHASGEAVAVLGDCHIVRQGAASLCHLGMWAWWEDFYHQRALPGRQANYRDFCSGNVSFRREDFLRVEGFDTAFQGYGGEDYELGYRLLQAGVRFIAEPRATAAHHHQATVAGVLRMTRQEAKGDVLLGRKHPELRGGLPLARIPPMPYKLLVHLALQAPALGDVLMQVVRWFIPFFERTHMRRRWIEYFGHVRGYTYWRGAREALGSWQALLDFQAGAITAPPATLDIASGLPTELPPVWVHGPGEIALSYHGQSLGAVRWAAPLEAPLRPYLADQIIRQVSRPLWLTLSQPAPTDTPPAPLPLPPISVIVCTRDRAQGLARCLASLLKLDYESFEVIVVDNASRDEATRQAVAATPFRYVREDRPGLDWARNRGYAEARHEVVAYIDDDAVADSGWLRGVALAFADPTISAMTGLVRPAELETEAQRLFEQYGGMGKGNQGRVFQRAAMSAAELLAAHACGVGANMAFRRAVLAQLGGFDTALDVGTPSNGGGDIDMFQRVLLAGHALRYEPTAVIAHYHRRDRAGLSRQIYNNGRAYGVYLLKAWRDGQVPRGDVLRYALRWMGGWVLARLFQKLTGRLNFPFDLVWAEAWGMMHAPWAYWATYWHDARLRLAYPHP